MLERVEKRELYAIGGNATDRVTMEQYGEFLKTRNKKPPYDPEIPPLCIYPEETKTEKHISS